MTKIEQIQHAISEANFFRSKLTPEALAVPGYTSLKIRHLFNNLGAISKNFVEIGSPAGACLCSGIFQNENLESVTAVDSFVEFNEERNPMHELLTNVGTFKVPDTRFKLIMQDCWDIKDHPVNIDFFSYDGPHSYELQMKAMTHYIDWFANEFIFCVDDYGWPFVTQGTKDGLALAELRFRLKNLPGYRVVWSQELWNGIEGDNNNWHNGVFVALCSKV